MLRKAVRRGGALRVGRHLCLAALPVALAIGGCGRQQSQQGLPDAGFRYLSSADVALAVNALATPVPSSEPSARAAESCACALWGSRPDLVFTSPVVPGATIAMVGDSACAGQSVRRRGSVRFAVALNGEPGRCVALDAMRDSLIMVRDTGRSADAAKQYLQAALMYVASWAPDLLDQLAIVTSTADVLAVMRGQPDTLASALDGRVWMPKDQSDIWKDSLTLAAGSAGPPWISTTGDPVKIIIATVHRARDGKVQLAPFSFVFRDGRIREVKSIFDPDYEPPPPEILKHLQ